MLLQRFAGLLAGFLYKIYSSTYRYEIQFEDPADKKIFFRDLSTTQASVGTNLIYACFHQDDLICLPYFSMKNICILISRSKDGQILASAVEHMGYQTVRGSSHRGGVAGLLAGMKKVIAGHSLTIAVDGPKGPIYKVKDGITAVSEKSKRPIVPLRGYPEWKVVFKKSWNKATLPLPLTKIVIKIGKIDFYSTEGLEKKMRAL
ncbi:MAG TPA: DUF374 domain-containing protein [Bacteriovoracaceae bacterium]|nr:DUF374 domain-containing protein [Bacteriovoracaceae bacterium]